ncbi:MAG: alpha/beta hydrolase [Rhizobiaceae bacterium]|nr:alpha/beta hydrolase [Rhizobiaceae bacterium]
MSSNQSSLILIPGVLSDKIVWEHAIEHFSKSMPVFVVDQTKHDNFTDMAVEALTLADGPLSIAGHSLGARVMMEMYRQAPERIDRLAFLDTRTLGVAEGEPAVRQTMIDLGFNEGLRTVAEGWLPPMVNPARHDDSELMGALFAMVERQTPQILERQLRAMMSRPDLEDVIKKITCPTLIAVGRQDGFSTVAMHEELAEKIPHAKLVIYEDAGHFAPIETPEQVTNSLVDWIASNKSA